MSIKRKKLTIIIAILIIFTVCIFSAMSNKKIRIPMREISYKNNSNLVNLSKLCIDLLNTDYYNKKIEYFPFLLDNYSQFTELTNFEVTDIKIDDLYDTIQNEYLFSYLYTNQFEEFKKKYVEIFPKFKSIGPNYEYILQVVYDDKTSNYQIKVILEALESNIDYISYNPYKQIGNLNTQSYIYEKIGDLENMNKVDKEAKDIYITIKSNINK